MRNKEITFPVCVLHCSTPFDTRLAKCSSKER